MAGMRRGRCDTVAVTFHRFQGIQLEPFSLSAWTRVLRLSVADAPRHDVALPDPPQGFGYRTGEPSFDIGYRALVPARSFGGLRVGAAMVWSPGTAWEEVDGSAGRTHRSLDKRTAKGAYTLRAPADAPDQWELTYSVSCARTRVRVVNRELLFDLIPLPKPSLPDIKSPEGLELALTALSRRGFRLLALNGDNVVLEGSDLMPVEPKAAE